MTDHYTPDQIEQAIRDISNRIARGVGVCAERYQAYLDADRFYDQLFASAFLDHDGPQYEKRYAAEKATTGARAQRDAADVAYRHADRKAKALELELRALQSVGASVRAMFTVAGRGE